MAAKLCPPLWPGPPCPRRPWPGGRGRLSVRTTVQVPGQPQARELPRPQHTPHARRQSPAAPRCPVPYCHRLPTPLAPPDTADGQARGARAGWGRLPFSGPEPRPARSPHKGSVGPRRLPHVCGFPAAGGTLPRLPAYPQPGPVVHSTGRERGLGVQLHTAFVPVRHRGWPLRDSEAPRCERHLAPGGRAWAWSCQASKGSHGN